MFKDPIESQHRVPTPWVELHTAIAPSIRVNSFTLKLFYLKLVVVHAVTVAAVAAVDEHVVVVVVLDDGQQNDVANDFVVDFGYVVAVDGEAAVVGEADIVEIRNCKNYSTH